MTIRKDFLGRGWAFPFRFDPASGKVALSEFEENIRQNILVILGTKPGERQMLPDFGCRIHDLLFAPNTPATAHLAQSHVQSALTRWEPRIQVLQVRSRPDPSGSLQVEVEYQIKSTQAVHNLTQVIAPTGPR